MKKLLLGILIIMFAGTAIAAGTVSTVNRRVSKPAVGSQARLSLGSYIKKTTPVAKTTTTPSQSGTINSADIEDIVDDRIELKLADYATKDDVDSAVKDIQTGGTEQSAADWDTILNKPDLADVATSGSYDDLADSPMTKGLGGVYNMSGVLYVPTPVLPEP